MPISTLDTRFVWWKPESGFEWGTTKKRDRQLRWTSERRGGYLVQHHPPIGLFRDFAGLRVGRPGAETEILSFANEYGDIIAAPDSSFYQMDNAVRRIVRRTATLSLWQHHVRQMRCAVRLWDRCNNAGTRKDARLQAHKDLQLEIESALKDVTTPRCSRVCLNQNLELFVYPVNLLAFMWLTLARLASGEIMEQPCLGECGGYIYTGLGLGLKRAGTATCSPACRKWKERHNR